MGDVVTDYTVAAAIASNPGVLSRITAAATAKALAVKASGVADPVADDVLESAGYAATVFAWPVGVDPACNAAGVAGITDADIDAVIASAWTAVTPGLPVDLSAASRAAWASDAGFQARVAQVIGDVATAYLATPASGTPGDLVERAIAARVQAGHYWTPAYLRDFASTVLTGLPDTVTSITGITDTVLAGQCQTLIGGFVAANLAVDPTGHTLAY